MISLIAGDSYISARRFHPCFCDNASQCGSDRQPEAALGWRCAHLSAGPFGLYCAEACVCLAASPGGWGVSMFADTDKRI